MFTKLRRQEQKGWLEGGEPMKGEYPGVSVTGRSESRKFRGWKPLSSFPHGIRSSPGFAGSFVRRTEGGAPFIQCRGCRGRDCEAKAIIVAKLERCRLRGWPTTRPNSVREWSVWRLIRRVRSRGILSDSNGTIPPFSSQLITESSSFSFYSISLSPSTLRFPSLLQHPYPHPQAFSRILDVDLSVSSLFGFRPIIAVDECLISFT